MTIIPIKRYLPILKSPPAITLAVSLALLAFNIAFIGKYRPFNSDDLYWQQAVRTWTPFNGDTLYLGTKDIFIEQVPLFAFMEHIFSPSRKLLIAEVLILTLSAFTMVYASTLYFLRKLRISPTYLALMPFVWLASFGYPIVQNYLNSDWRTFEVGISFATFAVVAAYLHYDIHPFRSVWTKTVTLLAIIFTGIVIYSDPYFIFFTIGPLALFTALLLVVKKISRRKFLVVIATIAASSIVAKLTEITASKAGIVIMTDTPSAFVNFDNIVTNIVSSLHGLLIIFGADFFGRPAFSLDTFGAIINALLLWFVLHKVYTFLKQFKQSYQEKRITTLEQQWPVFFALMIVIVYVVYTSSSLVVVENYRFFIHLVFCAITLLTLTLAMTCSRAIKIAVASLLAIATVFNMATTVRSGSITNQGNVRANVSNSLNYRIIETVQSEGLMKGYASYWHGNVNTYLSKDTITFLPTLCTPEGTTVRFQWLIDGSLYDRSAKKSFYIIDPDIAAPAICTRTQLEVQFGPPQKVISVENKSILIYDYDIGSRIN